MNWATKFKELPAQQGEKTKERYLTLMLLVANLINTK